MGGGYIGQRAESNRNTRQREGKGKVGMGR